MDAIKTIPWRNINDLAIAITGTHQGVSKHVGPNGGWSIYVDTDYTAAKKGSVLYYNIYGGFITRVRKGFSERVPLIYDKRVPLYAFTVSNRGRRNAA